MKRIGTLLLCMLFCISLFSGCRSISKLWQEDASGLQELPYCLDQTMIDTFYSCLETAETLSIAGENMDAIDAAVLELDEAYLALIDQNQIAYLHYCLDQTDAQYSERYLYSTNVVADVESDYNAALKRIYLSETPVRDELFADWTAEQIDQMLKYDDQIAQLEKRNAELLLEFRELEDATRDAGMIPLYNEFVRNNNAIARIYGYENYYEYAYKMVYRRDYGQQELENMRGYISRYLLPACEQVNAEFDAVYSSMGTAEQQELVDLLYDPYTESGHVRNYVQQLKADGCEGMEELFTQKRAVYTSYRNAYRGAYTTWIGGKPFCYFGPDYSDSQTLIHELGHYYGSLYVEPWSQPMDLSETQSQGNEWLFTAYLEEQLDPLVYRAFCAYKLGADMAGVAGYVLIDCFEEQVYSHERAGELTLEEYDELMAEAAENFGGIDYIISNLFDIQAYWKRIVIESPVYYISYAVSSVAAMDLYLTAMEDEALARQQYTVLIEEPVENGGFLANIRNAGIAGPFEETVYAKLYDRYAN